MPVKFKETSRILVDRAAKKYKTVHYYMHTTSTKELVEYMNSSNALPKTKQKVSNELVKRGVSWNG